MNLYTIDFSVCQKSAHQFVRLAAKAERRVLKRWLKHPLAQWGIKLENNLEVLLSFTMQTFKTIEQGLLPRLGEAMLLGLARLVRKDGLKLTILLTMLGYATWCINHL